MPLANFYTKAGWMFGVDMHDYNCISPISPLPVDIPFWPHVTAVPFGSLLTNGQHRSTVTNDGCNMVVSNFDVYFVPHCPLPFLPPGPKEGLTWGLIEILSGTEVLFGQDSVTAGGEDTSIALWGAFGLNVNCSDPFDHPLGATYNPNTVQTFVSMNALLSSVLGYAFVTVLSLGVKKLVGGLVGLSKVEKLYAGEITDELVDEMAKEAGELAVAPGEKLVGFVMKKYGAKDLVATASDAVFSHLVRLTPLIKTVPEDTPYVGGLETGKWANLVTNPFDPTGTSQGWAADGASKALAAVGLE